MCYPFNRSALTREEIRLGIVLRLCPDTLAANGGQYSCPDVLRVQGRHAFLCVGVSGDVSIWIPLYSKGGRGRELVSSSGRTGHPGWTNGVSYFHPAQTWTARSGAVIRAAAAGCDPSTSGNRNLLDAAMLPKVIGPKQAS